MASMLHAISSAQSLADVIGEPCLIRHLDALFLAAVALGEDGTSGPIGESYALLGLPSAYVWDDHSSKLRDVLMRILVMAENTGDSSIINACKTVEERFIRMSERIAYVEITCRQTVSWT